jgi:hypothetical protein
MFFRIEGEPWKGAHKDKNAEQPDYIRDPLPRLLDHVGVLDEDEYKALADKHIAANEIDEAEAKRYLSRAGTLRAQLSECEAKAKQHRESLQKGREVVNNLLQGIMYRERETQREAAQLRLAKRKRVN